MNKKTIIKKGVYYDSVFLMNISEEMQKLEGINSVIIVMGTDMNKSVIEELGMSSIESKEATANDLIITLELKNEEVITEVLSHLDEILSKKTTKSNKEQVFSSSEMAMAANPGANLVIISTPGEFAASEAKKAVKNGLHAFIFSDNVPIEEEIELKQLGQEKGILVMGPGCGTSIINNVSIGMVSKVSLGSIGIVGASGSGLHEIAVLIDRNGFGISQAIGTGGRDLSDEVGGITMLQGLNFLEQDSQTEVIVLVSKPPAPKTMAKVLKAVASCSKPVVIHFLGGDEKLIKEAGAIPSKTLEDAAYKAMSLLKKEELLEAPSQEIIERLKELAAQEKMKLTTKHKYLRGLFCGGTHSEESILILQKELGEIYSNVNFKPSIKLNDSKESYKNSLIDMGDEEFTKGKPHPVIDPSILKERLRKEGRDPEVAVILLDVLLGHGAHHDPAGVLTDTLKELKEEAKKDGRYLSIVISICGTDKDPQNLRLQEERFREAGVLVLPTNAQATILSGLIIT